MAKRIAILIVAALTGAALAAAAFIAPVFAAGPVTVVYYSATWCAPCHKVEPMVRTWAAIHSFTVIKIDYDSLQGRSDRAVYKLQGVPDLRIGDHVYSPDWIGGYSIDYLDSFFTEVTNQ